MVMYNRSMAALDSWDFFLSSIPDYRLKIGETKISTKQWKLIQITFFNIIAQISASMNVFYQPDFPDNLELSGEEFLHCVKVLRHREKDIIQVTNGNGAMFKASIEKVLKKSLTLNILEKITQPPRPFATHLYIAPTKNLDRMEWLVEKAAEISVTSITFIKTENSERKVIKLDRLEKKSISALKQSRSAWKLKINALVTFEKATENLKGISFLGFLGPDLPPLANIPLKANQVNLFIGPEGDFAQWEVDLGSKLNIKPVNLGPSVLRTETAGLLACHTVLLRQTHMI